MTYQVTCQSSVGGQNLWTVLPSFTLGI